MPAWKPQYDVVSSCTPTRDGSYLICSVKGYTAVSAQPVDVGARLPIRGGQLIIKKGRDA